MRNASMGEERQFVILDGLAKDLTKEVTLD